MLVYVLVLGDKQAIILLCEMLWLENLYAIRKRNYTSQVLKGCLIMAKSINIGSDWDGEWESKASRYWWWENSMVKNKRSWNLDNLASWSAYQRYIKMYWKIRAFKHCCIFIMFYIVWIWVFWLVVWLTSFYWRLSTLLMTKLHVRFRNVLL